MGFVRVGPWPDSISLLIGRDTWEFTLSELAEEKRCEDKAAVCKPGRELSPGVKPCQNLDLRLSRLQNCEEPNVFLNYPAYDILLWQPKLANTVGKVMFIYKDCYMGLPIG